MFWEHYTNVCVTVVTWFMHLSFFTEISQREFATRLARWFKVCDIAQPMCLHQWSDLWLISCVCVWMKVWTLQWNWSSSWFRCFSTCIMMPVWPPAVESYYRNWCPLIHPQPCSSSLYTHSHSWPHPRSSISQSRSDQMFIVFMQLDLSLPYFVLADSLHWLTKNDEKSFVKLQPK